MLSDLIELAHEPSSERRRQLLAGLAALFESERDAMTEHELSTFGEIVTRILRDVPAAAREDVSNRMAHEALTPRPVAIALASDEAAEVAIPMLTHSPVLTDEDLVGIAQTRTGEHRLAIARRAQLGQQVTNALIRLDDAAVLETLAENPGAAISAKGFDRLADRAATNEQLRDKLCLRTDQPVESARRLLPYLEPGARRRLQALMAENGKPLDDLMQKVVPELARVKLGQAKGRVQVKAMVADAEAGRVPFDAVISMLCAEGRHLDAALAISEYTLLPLKQVTNAVLSTRADALALICKASGITLQTYLAFDKLRCEQMKIAQSDPSRLAEAYDAIDQASAQRTLRFVKVRADLLAAS